MAVMRTFSDMGCHLEYCKRWDGTVHLCVQHVPKWQSSMGCIPSICICSCIQPVIQQRPNRKGKSKEHSCVVSWHNMSR